MKRTFTKYPSSYVKASQEDSSSVKITKKLRREIYEFCDGCGGYSDYNQKIEDVMEEFGLTRDQAENEVWNWSINWQE